MPQIKFFYKYVSSYLYKGVSEISKCIANKLPFETLVII